MASVATAAGQFFEEFKANDIPGREAFLRKLFDAADPRFETESLDFKGCQWIDASTGNVEYLAPNKVKELWSKALSAFANTGGGVLVWGIEARNDQATKVDAASDFARVKDPLAHKSRLWQLHHEATDPPVLGVEIEHWEDPARVGEGVVVCHIPESPHRPHRAEFVTNKPYYIRVGDDFVISPVSILRHLFFPYAAAVFRVDVVYLYRFAPDPPTYELTYELQLSNSGTATAVDSVVAVSSSFGLHSPPPHVETRQGQGWSAVGHHDQRIIVPGGDAHEFAGPEGMRGPVAQKVYFTDKPIHPGMTSTVIRTDRRVPFKKALGDIAGPIGSAVGGATFDVMVLATNCRPETFKVTVPDDECVAEGPRRIAGFRLDDTFPQS
jgi:hypothetical protein